MTRTRRSTRCARSIYTLWHVTKAMTEALPIQRQRIAGNHYCQTLACPCAMFCSLFEDSVPSFGMQCGWLVTGAYKRAGIASSSGDSSWLR